MASYMDGSPNLSVTVTNSQAVRRVMMQKPPVPAPAAHREPYAPYASGASNYTGINRPQRVSSAPIRRLPLGASHQPCGPTNPHRPQSATMGAINTDVSNNAPYASRMQESSLFMSASGSRYPGGMSYSPLTDKHLQDYFMKKFMNPRPPSAARKMPRKATSTKAQNNHANLKKKGDVTYKILVTTGNKKNAATDAKIFLRINGTKGKLPKQHLKKSGASVKKKKKFKFAKGSTNVFKITGKDVGELKSIFVESDGLTREQGWYLEQIEIIKRIPATGKEKSWIFFCNNWLSLHEGDCQLSRELFAKHSSKTEYEVVVVTGDQKGAGTDANVFITLYGKNGNSPKLQLKNNSKNSFERNHTDMFMMKSQCCGPLEKIRIQHDNTGFGAGWFLERVVVTDLKNPKWKYYFPCGQWLAKDEADGLICRDLLGSRDPLAVRKTNKYKVTVHTGDKRGAGTDADVLINIFGELGNSGERKLDNNRNNFERKQVDEFIVEGAPLGKLKRIRIGHDDSGPGAGWFLDKVLVEDMETRKQYEFPCNRWLAKDEDDGQTQRDLMCDIGPQDAPPGIPYTIHVSTSDVSQAGTSARVYLIMYGGKKGEETSGKIWLDGGKFSRGRKDIFNVEVIDALMPLSKIDIGHDNSGAGAGWHLDRVMINCPSAGMEQWFLCNKWFATGEGDGLIERELYESVSMRKIRKKLTTWHIWVHTSDTRGAGTDANVLLVAYGKTKDGEYKKSDEIVLDNKGDNFESGECDKFKIEMVDIGKPYKIRVGHDNSGSFAGWHLDKIEMENMATQKRYTFNCGRWLADDEDDGEIVRELPAEGEDIKKIQRVLQYQVDVHTGKKSGAGTDANVFLNIFGEQGDTGERKLKKSKTNRNKFEKGNVDEFIVDAVNLKALKKIRIGHDGTRAGDGWFLDKVLVRPMDDSAEAVEFECNRWLDIKEDDGLIVREITAGGAQMLNTTSYHTSIKTGDIMGAGTDANVFIKIFGEKGDTGVHSLKSADNTKNKFERARTDLFKLEATDIGKIEKIRIGHDGANPGSGWFLDEVRIDVPSKGENYVFACHRWLDTKEEDGQLEIEIEPTDFRQGAAKIPYEVTVWTGDVRGAGTDANVFVQMYGEYGKSESFQLRNRTDNFEQGQMDKFKIEAEDIGPLLKVRVGHDGKGMFAGWFLEKILIQRHLKKGSKRRRKDSVFNRRQSTHQIKRGDAYSDSEDEKDKKQKRSRSMSAGRRRSGYDTEETDDESPRKMGRTSSLRSPRDGRSPRDAPSAYGRRKSQYPDSDEDSKKRRKSKFSTSKYSDDSDDDLKKRRKSKFGISSKKSGKYSDDSDDDQKKRRKSKFGLGSKQNGKYSDDSDDDQKKRRKSKFGLGSKQNGKYSDDSDDDLKKRRKSKFGLGSKQNGKYSDDSDDDFKKRRKSKFSTSKYSDESDEDQKKRRKSKFGIHGIKKQDDYSDDERSTARRKSRLKSDAHGYDDDLYSRNPGDSLGHRSRASDAHRYSGRTSRGDLNTNYSNNNKDGNTNNSNNKGDDSDGGYDHRRRQSQSPAPRRKSYFNTSDDETRSQSVGSKRLSMFQASGSGASKSSMFQASSVRARSQSGGRSNNWEDSGDEDPYASRRKSLAGDARRGSLGGSLKKNQRSSWQSDDESGEEMGRKKTFSDKRKSVSGSSSTFGRKKYDDDYDAYKDSYDGRGSSMRKSFSAGPFSSASSGNGRGKKNNWAESDEEEDKYGRKKSLGGSFRKQSSFRKSYEDDQDSDKDSRRKSLGGGLRKQSSFRKSYEDDRDSDKDSRRKSLGGGLRKQSSFRKSYEDDQDSDKDSRRKSLGGGLRKQSSFRKSYEDDQDSDKDSRRKSSTFRRESSSPFGRRKSKWDSDEEDKYDRGQKNSLKKKSNLNRTYSDDEDDYKGKSGLRRKSNLNRTYSDDEDDYNKKNSLRRKSNLNRTYSDEEDDDKRKTSMRKKSTFNRKFSDDEEDEEKLTNLERRKLYSQNLNQRKKSVARPTSAKGRKDDSDDESLSKKSLRRPSSVKGRSSSAGRYASDSDEDKKKRRKSKYDRDFDNSDDDKRKGRRGSNRDSKDNDEGEVEEYWFVCNRWFAKKEDDGKIVRELLPTTEGGIPLDTGLSEIQYRVKVVTGDVWGAGTDANVFVNLYGEFGDTGERQLKDSDNINKFERNQEDTFEVGAIELGKLKKLKIRHDNKGGGGAWYLSHVEVEDPKNHDTYFFPCQRWLATDEDDGQIARVLVPADKSLMRKLSEKDSKSVRKEIALETKAAMETYHVYVYTGDKWGAGTDANVYVVLFGDSDDTGQVWLKTSKTNKNKFERKQMDEFIIEAVDIGELRKIKIGHDNAGGGGAWFLDRVEIDCPALGRKWVFPSGRWLAKGEDDGQLERELYPQDMATEEYVPSSDSEQSEQTHISYVVGSPISLPPETCCTFFRSLRSYLPDIFITPSPGPGIPYEITTHTSDMSSAGTNADVYVVLYGHDSCTEKKSLCANKNERRKCFERGQVDKFVLELEDVGDMIEKLRIGHDGKGWASGWHLDKVEVRRLKDSGKGCEIFTFPCNRWLARGEEDGAIERELVPDKIVTETTRKDGSLKRKEKDNRHGLTVKNYVVDVYTGDVRGAGTDANVFLTIHGDKGDSGERKLHKSETHSNKFERAQVDTFTIEAGDLGKLYKIRIRHDNAMFSPAWFLDKVEIADNYDREKYTFYSERWFGKSKDDGKIDRNIYVKGYEGEMSSQGTLHSGRRFGGSISSLDSMRSTDPFSKSPRLPRRQLEEIPEGPTIPYTIRVVTGEDKDMGTESNVYIKMMGPKKKQTGKQFLELAQKKRFEPASMETFSVEAVDVQEVKEIEIGHDGVTPGSGWYLKEVEIDMPTKGKHYFFSCKAWLARDRGDGKISRTFTLRDGDNSMISYKPMVPYEITLYTGDVKDAGTDAQIFVKVFGAGGSSSDITLDKHSERFERGRTDLLRLEIEDIAPIKKLRVGHDGKGSRPEWYLEKVELRNMDTGDLTVFKAGSWFSTKRGDGKIARDFVATVKGKDQLKPTTYKVNVKTSDIRGAGTDANVYAVLFGANGDSGELHLKDSETNKSPFENNQTDVFTFPHMLSLGTLTKCRVWHDNKGFGAAWHLTHIEVEDIAGKQKYMFPCNRWLSKSDDDKLICRELTCANMPSPGTKDKVTYEIEVTTSDKKDAGMIHNAWIILDGDIKSSKDFVMENSSKKQVLRRGQTDVFTMVSKNVGHIERCMLGAVEREDKPLRSVDGRDGMWHCHEVTVTNKTSGDKYFFPCKAWISISQSVSRKYAKVLDCKKMEESKLSAVKNLGTVKYEVVVVTGDIKHSGTDANVFINVYGTNGDTGKRPLTQKFRNLFERNQTDKFILEAVDLGDLSKVFIEHDNKGFGAGWYLERIEVTNQASNRTWTFPCAKWLDKSRGDGAITRELYPRD